MMKITVPASIDEAQDRLGSLGKLLTATEWEKAAIVASFVEEPGQGARTDLATSSQVMSPHQFATLGIVGLKSKDTVRRYVNAWMDQVGTAPKPGHEIDLPNVEFPQTSVTKDTERGAQKVQDIRNNITATAKALDDESTAEKVVSKMTPDARRKVAKALNENLDPEFQAMLDRSEKAREERLSATGGVDPIDAAVEPAFNALSGVLIDSAAQKVTDAIGKFKKNPPTDPEVILMLQDSYLNLKGLVQELGTVLGMTQDWDEALSTMTKGGN